MNIKARGRQIEIMEDGMFELAAAIFFTFALIAPLAVIILMLHGNWAKIVAALRAAPERRSISMRTIRPYIATEPANDGGYRTVIRRQPRLFQPERAAA